MDDAIETDNYYKLRQELKMIGPVLESKLQIAKDLLKEADLESLHLLAEGNGTCCFQFNNNKWNFTIGSVLQEPNEQQNRILCTLFALLWQTNELKQVPYDPFDLGVARRSKKKKQEEGYNTEENTSSIIWGKDEENSSQDSEYDELALSEDGSNYLIGPYEIDLERKDLRNSLFVYYRKSCERRQRHFLNSKHLPKARKLSGINVYRYGYEFNRAVLEKAAASLEELNIEGLAHVQHLDVLENLYMPKLCRLNLWLKRVVGETEKPFVFPAPLEGNIGLRYLRAHMPRLALESLLTSNANTLLELHLKVGTANPSWDTWPNNCRDLYKLLLCCKGTLRRLVLIRDLYTHTRAACKDQVKALEHNLPGLSVTCEYCCSK